MKSRIPAGFSRTTRTLRAARPEGRARGGAGLWTTERASARRGGWERRRPPRRTRRQAGFCTLVARAGRLGTRQPCRARQRPIRVHIGGSERAILERPGVLRRHQIQEKVPGVWRLDVHNRCDPKRTAPTSEPTRTGPWKTHTANEIAKYLKQAEKLDAQEKRSAESPAQAGVGKTGQASAAKRLPARTPSSTSSPTCALPLRPPRPVASQASNAAQGTRPSSPSAGCSSIIELVEHASTRRNGSDSSAAQGGGRARRAMLASAPAPSYPPVGDTFEPGMVGLENLATRAS